MPGRIVLFGATGYTGDLTARALAARGAEPVLAGRSRAKLDALAGELGGLETRVADVSEPDSVRDVVERGDVLVSTVGPFVRFGEPAITAAIARGAHYIDSTGEAQFIRQVFERYGHGAQAAGCGLLTAFGGDWVPGNLAGALALREAGGDAKRVEVAYYATGSGMGGDGMSGGTRASAAGVMLDPGFTFRDGRLVTERNAARVKHFETRPGREKPAVSVGTSEHFALPRLAPGLLEVDVYLGWFGPASRALQAFAAGGAVATRVPGVKAVANAAAARFVKGSSGGPDAAARAGTGTLVLASAFDAGGEELSHVRLEGANGYDFTAAMLAWSAEQAAGGALQGTGALGPVDAFGLDVLEAGVAEAGIRRA